MRILLSNTTACAASLLLAALPIVALAQIAA